MADERSADWFRQWEQSVARWWDTVLDDPVFVQGMGERLAGGAEARTAWEDGVDRTMAQMHLPSKTDVVRVARIASVLEDRLVALEDLVADTRDRLDRVEKEVLRARIDAMQALVEVRDRLDAIDGRLASLAPRG